MWCGLYSLVWNILPIDLEINIAQIHYFVFDHLTHRNNIQSKPWNLHHTIHNQGLGNMKYEPI